MPLEQVHPEMTWWNEQPHRCRLIGSRMVGVHHKHSDYDVLVLVDPPGATTRNDRREAASALCQVLRGRGYERLPGGGGYLPDPALHAVMCLKGAGSFPPVDALIVVDVAEYERRCAFFDAQVQLGNDRGGRLALALKQSTGAWGSLWDALRHMEPSRVGPYGVHSGNVQVPEAEFKEIRGQLARLDVEVDHRRMLRDGLDRLVRVWQDAAHPPRTVSMCAAELQRLLEMVDQVRRGELKWGGSVLIPEVTEVRDG